jgi:hypothetical protein
VKRALLILSITSLTGCAICERHPVACAIAIGSIALSVPHIVDHKTGTSGTDGRDVQVPTVDCSTGGCR